MNGGYGPPPGGGYGPPPGGGGYGPPPPGGFGQGGMPFGPTGPQMPQMGGPMGPGYGPQGGSSGLAVASLICGIMAIPTTCCCSLASLPLAIAACVMGGIQMSKVSANPMVYGGKGMALGGLITGVVAILMSVVFLALGMGQALIDHYNASR